MVVDSAQVEDSKINEDIKASNSYLKEEMTEEEASGSKSTDARHVMFQTDDFNQSITEAVWFGEKIPARRRNIGRGIMSGKEKDPVSEYFEDPIDFQKLKDDVIKIADFY